MPVVSRHLDYCRQQRDGTFICRERMVDHLGRNWYRGPRIGVASEAQANTDRDAYDWVPQLRNREEVDAITAVEGGADASTFTGVDLTTADLQRRLLVRFARGIFEIDRRFLLGLAPFVAGRSAGEVASALGISPARAQALIDREIGRAHV